MGPGRALAQPAIGCENEAQHKEEPAEGTPNIEGHGEGAKMRKGRMGVGLAGYQKITLRMAVAESTMTPRVTGREYQGVPGASCGFSVRL